MLSISRLLIRQFRSVCRRAGIKPTGGRDPLAALESGPEGLVLAAVQEDRFVAYRQPGPFDNWQTAVPLSLLADCEGRTQDTVTFQHTKTKELSLTWSDMGIPLSRTIPFPDKKQLGPLPESPPEFTSNKRELLAALASSSTVVDPQAGRFALQHVQLVGEAGQVVATDGKQLLIQSGFAFPWTEALLVPATAVFGASELQAAGTVEVGRTPQWIQFLAGNWTIGLRIYANGRFPDVARIMPTAEPAAAAVLSPSDAEFLRQALSRLPGETQPNQPITLDLGSQLIVRAKDPNQPTATELALTGAQVSGTALVDIDRRYLARALELGLRALRIFDAKSPVVFCDGDRQFLVAPLHANEPHQAESGTVRIESPGPAQSVTSSPTSPPTIPMTNPIPASDNTNLPAATTAALSTEPKRPRKTGPSALDQAVAFRTALRNAAIQANELVKALKRDHRQQRIVKETLRSLKQLQAA